MLIKQPDSLIAHFSLLYLSIYWENQTLHSNTRTHFLYFHDFLGSFTHNGAYFLSFSTILFMSTPSAYSRLLLWESLTFLLKKIVEKREFQINMQQMELNRSKESVLLRHPNDLVIWLLHKNPV